MEKHIFKFGKNSLAIIIPKKWTEKNGLKPSSQIFLSENETGSLILSAAETSRTEAEVSIESKTDAGNLARWVGLHYMYGTGKLHIHSEEGLKELQTETIENKINAECPGFEITSQSSKDIFIEDLTNIKEIDLEKIIMRLRSLVDQEFREVREGDPRTIPKVEKLVNRFYMLGMRYVNITQAKDALMYATVLEKLEAISDNFNILAASLDIKGMRVFAELNKQFDGCFSAFNGDQKSIEQVSKIRKDVVKQIQRLRIEPIYKYLLRNIAYSISNISEFGLKRNDSSVKEFGVMEIQ